MNGDSAEAAARFAGANKVDSVAEVDPVTGFETGAIQNKKERELFRVCVDDTIVWLSKDGVCMARAARRGKLIVADVLGVAGYLNNSFDRWAGAAKWIEKTLG